MGTAGYPVAGYGTRKSENSTKNDFRANGKEVSSANVYRADDYSEDNPVYLVKGVDKNGNEYEQTADVSKVNPNCSYRLCRGYSRRPARLYLYDNEGTVYNVEMERGKHKRAILPKRSRYYQGSIDLDIISAGEDYRKLKKSFVIFICTFDPFGDRRHLYTFENRCVENPSLTLGDETTKIFLNTKGSMHDVDPEMQEFLAYPVRQRPPNFPSL